MRLLLVLIAVLSADARAEHHEQGYTEDRLLIVDSDGVGLLVIDAGAGSLSIIGTDDADGIMVQAVVRVNTKDANKAKGLIKKRLALSLEQSGDTVTLQSKFNDGLRFWTESGSVDLVVQIPTDMNLDIIDGAGSLVVEGVRGRITIDDGSGSVRLSRVGSVQLEDGSGSINISDVIGDLSIEDGSGGMAIRSVDGNVTVRDGSGSMQLADISGDVLIEEDGSGSVNTSSVKGAVIRNDR